MSEQKEFQVGDLVRVDYSSNNVGDINVNAMAWDLSSDRYKYIDDMTVGIVVDYYRHRVEPKPRYHDSIEKGFCHIMIDGCVYEILTNCLVHYE